MVSLIVCLVLASQENITEYGCEGREDGWTRSDILWPGEYEHPCSQQCVTYCPVETLTMMCNGAI